MARAVGESVFFFMTSCHSRTPSTPTSFSKLPSINRRPSKKEQFRRKTRVELTLCIGYLGSVLDLREGLGLLLGVLAGVLPVGRVGRVELNLVRGTIHHAEHVDEGLRGGVPLPAFCMGRVSENRRA